MGEMLV